MIYETHVRGFTIHPSAGVARPGTYTGLIEKIPYLQDLGITSVELLPVQAFNENKLQRINPLTGERLRNYWGYNPVALMAPHAGYASESDRGITDPPPTSPRNQEEAFELPSVDEGIEGGEWLGRTQQKFGFKEMVRACHRAGIEVILDVVLNHTAEGDELGPTLNLRGIDNEIYYILADDKRSYLDYSGVGNTVNANHPVVRDYLMDVLRYWVMEMHVDGFRFDLASVLGRDEHGVLLANAPLLERIAEDPILCEVKLIAEA